MLGEREELRRDPIGRYLAEGEPFFGLPYGRLEEPLPPQLPVVPRKRLPGVRVARRRDRFRAPPVLCVVRRRGTEHLRIQRSGHPAAGVKEPRLFFFGVVEDEGPVAADAAHHRLDDTEGGGNGNGRIEGVAALREDLQTRLRRQRVCRADHTGRSSSRARRAVLSRFPSAAGSGRRGRWFG